jgi:predicted RNase H-like HicB family nuclease
LWAKRGRGGVASQYTAVIKQADGWWIGWVAEVPGVNCQERTREELLERRRVTLKEAIDLNRQDALSAAGSAYVEEEIGV